MGSPRPGCGGIRRGEVVRKFDRPAENLQVSGWAASVCKSVGVYLRRFESCTCHRLKRASDLVFYRAEALSRCPAVSGQIRLSTAISGEYAWRPGKPRGSGSFRSWRSRQNYAGSSAFLERIELDLRPSQHTTSTSRIPRLASSAQTPAQNFAPSLVCSRIVNTCLTPSMSTPTAM